MLNKKLPILLFCILGTALLSACGSGESSNALTDQTDDISEQDSAVPDESNEPVDLGDDSPEQNSEAPSEGSEVSDLGAVSPEQNNEAPDEGNNPSDVSDDSLEKNNQLGLEKAKAMVADIRKLPTTVVEPFEAQSNQITQVFEGDSGASLMAVAEAAEAIWAAADAYAVASDLRSYTHQENLVLVNINVKGDLQEYTVNQDVIVNNEVVAVTLVAEEASSFVSSDSIEQGIEVTEQRIDFNFTVEGFSTTNDSILTINSGNLIFKNIESKFGNGYTSSKDNNLDTFNDFEDTTFDSLELSMNATLSKTSSETTSFTGEISLTMNNLSFQFSSVEVTTFGDQYGWVEDYSQIISFENAEFKIAGDFTTTDNTQMNADFMLAVELGDFVSTCKGVDSYNGQTGFDSSKECTEETEDNYVDISFSLSFGLDQTGELPDVSVMLSGERTGLETLGLEAEIISGSTILDMDLNYDDQEIVSMTITNQDSVIATMQYAQQDEVTEPALTGSISYKGVEYATISDEIGIPAVSYIDGENESL